jgi:glycosyltransferase involved in cell wall biosynthesis
LTSPSRSLQAGAISERKDAPPVAVTIPTRNAAGTLDACLSSAIADGVPCEVVVADDCSTDVTREIARRFGARVLEGPLPLLEARYQAVNATDAECVILVDSDQILEPGTVRRCVQMLDRYDALILEETSAEPSTWIERLYAADKRYLHADDAQHMDPIHGSLLPRAFRRGVLLSAFEAIPEQIRMIAVAQDHAIIYEAFSKTSSSVGLVRDAVRHQEMKTIQELFRKYFKWGAGLVDLFDQGPDYKALTRAKIRGRLHRGGASWGDFAASLLLLALKAVPYGLGYTFATLSRQFAGWKPR